MRPLFRRSARSTDPAVTTTRPSKKAFRGALALVLSLALGAGTMMQGAGSAEAMPMGSIDAALTVTGQPGPHRVPGHYFTSPTAPRIQRAAGNTPVVGPSTPVEIGNLICTISVAGFDRAGNKVAITAGHCGAPGTPVRSMDARGAGVIGQVVMRSSLDYGVIRLRGDVQLTRNYGRAHINRLGGPIPATGATICKTGISTGTSCGPVLALSGANFFSHFCGSYGDSGAPVYRQGRLVGILNGGLQSLPSCRTPIQGPLHSPTISTAWNVIQAELNAHGGVGAGFRLP